MSLKSRRLLKDIKVLNVTIDNLQGKCWGCYQTEVTGLLVITTWPSDRAYHLQCYIKNRNYTKYHVPCCTSDIGGWDLLNIAQQYKVINYLLPDHISIPLRYSLKINQFNFNNLTDEELKKYLIQRDIKFYNTEDKYQPSIFNRNYSLKLLQTFLDKSECREKNQCLIYGFCNEMSKEIRLTVPMVIYELILKYCALYVWIM